MKRNLSIKIDDYTLEVEDFEDWIVALADIELGRIKLELTKAAGLSWPFDISSGLNFSAPAVTSKDQIVCALLLQYPKGLSKKELQLATDMKSDSLATYLTSKQEKIAEGIQRQDEVYLLKSDWLHLAMEIARDVIDKCRKAMISETQNEEVPND